MAQTVITEYPHNDMVRALTNNATTTAFISRVADVLTEPVSVDSSTATSNAVVIPASGAGVMMVFFGSDGDDETTDYRIYGVDRMQATAAAKGVDPVYQYHYTFALEFETKWDATTVGVANGLTVAADLYADIITPDVTNVGMADYQVISPDVADLPGALVIRNSYGFRYWAVDFNVNTAASANLLWKTI